jgi:hypothetical protein
MYTVSDAYKTAMKKPVQQFRLTGTVGTVPFTDQNVLKGSFSVTNQCCDESSILIGQVYIGELNVTFINIEIPRYAWKGLTIKASCGLKLSDGTYEDVPFGVYTIDEAKWTRAGIVVKAYDNMAKFDQSYMDSQTNGQLYDLLLLACKDCNVELALTKEQCEALPNGTDYLSVYTENDISTYRDYLSWLSQACACNALIDREGKLTFKTYGTTPVDTISDHNRLTGGSFCDYETVYTGVSVVDSPQKKTEYYHEETDTGLTYNLGSNPFLQYGVKETKQQHCMNILNSLQAVKYVPFSISMLGSPAYDLMDVFIFSDGLADQNKIYCMTKFTFHYDGSYEMEGVGSNPNLSSAKSKTDKDLSGLLSSTKADQLVFYSYVNAREINLYKDDISRIVSITFATSADSAEVSIWWEANLNIKFDDNYTFQVTNTSSADPLSASNIKIVANHTNAKCKVYYYLNGNLQTYEPVETWDEAGMHTLHRAFYLGNCKANQTYTVQVCLQMFDCTATAAPEDVHALITGTGLIGTVKWDGTIHMEETFPPIAHANPKILVASFKDSASVGINVVSQLTSFREQFTGIPVMNNVLVVSLADSFEAATVVTSFTIAQGRNDPQYSEFIQINVNGAFTLKTSGYIYRGTAVKIDSGLLSELDLPSDDFTNIAEVTYQ